MPPVATIAASQGNVPPAVRTPVILPSAVSSDVTARWIHLQSAQYAESARTMSDARSETGNTRLPRSVFSGTPRSSKNAMVSCGENAEWALYKNLPLRGIAARNASRSQLLVTLQRPFPVMPSLRPGRSFFSNTVTCAPASAAHPAAIMPAAPPPMTAILFFSVILFFVDLVGIPDSFQTVEGWRQFRLLFLHDGHD